MYNILWCSADSCSMYGICAIVAKVRSLWEGLGTHMQLVVQLSLLLLIFWVLSRLFACKSNKTSCLQGCKCGCGVDCTCKENEQ